MAFLIDFKRIWMISLCFVAGLLYVMPISYLFIILLVISVCGIRFFNIYTDLYSIIIYLYAIIYLVFSIIKGQSDIIIVFKEVVMPVVAYCFARKISEEEDIQGKDVVIGLIAYTCGCVITNTIVTITSGTSQLMIPWNKEIVSPINLNAYNVIAIGLFYNGTFIEKDIKRKALSILLSTISLYLSFITVRRTNILLFIIILLVNVLIFRNYNKIKLLFLFIITAIALLLVDIDSLAIVQRGKNELSARASLGGRFYMWSYYLNNMWSHPLGGNDYRASDIWKWAHNIFLDLYIDKGVVVMFALLLIYIIHLIELYMFKDYELMEDSYKSIIISSSLGIFLCCFIEPAYGGFFFLVVVSFFLFGYVHSHSSLK